MFKSTEWPKHRGSIAGGFHAHLDEKKKIDINQFTQEIEMEMDCVTSR